jgi:hypothetical protein
MGAALTACIGGGSSKAAKDTTGGAAGRRADITIARTLSSLEAAAVAVYTTGIDSGLLTTPAVADLAKQFRAQHQEHAALFEGTTRDLRGTPFDDPNPSVMQQLQPAIGALHDEGSVVALVLDVETILAQTYQGTMGAYGDKSFNVAAMSVGGAEARHAAALALVLGQPGAPAAFQATSRVVQPGTGV